MDITHLSNLVSINKEHIANVKFYDKYFVTYSSREIATCTVNMYRIDTCEKINTGLFNNVIIFEDLGIYIAHVGGTWDIYDLNMHTQITCGQYASMQVYKKQNIYKAYKDGKCRLYQLYTNDVLVDNDFEDINVCKEHDLYMGLKDGRWNTYRLGTNEQITDNAFENMVVYPEIGIFIARIGKAWGIYKLGGNKRDKSLNSLPFLKIKVYKKLGVYAGCYYGKWKLYSITDHKPICKNDMEFDDIIMYESVNGYAARIGNKWDIYSIETGEKLNKVPLDFIRGYEKAGVVLVSIDDVYDFYDIKTFERVSFKNFTYVNVAEDAAVFQGNEGCGRKMYTFNFMWAPKVMEQYESISITDRVIYRLRDGHLNYVKRAPTYKIEEQMQEIHETELHDAEQIQMAGRQLTLMAYNKGLNKCMRAMRTRQQRSA